MYTFLFKNRTYLFTVEKKLFVTLIKGVFSLLLVLELAWPPKPPNFAHNDGNYCSDNQVNVYPTMLTNSIDRWYQS